MGKRKELDLDDGEKLVRLGKALSSDVRIQMLRLLTRQELNVNEISEILSIPQSSAAANVKVLEEAGLLRSKLQTATRGQMKVCKAAVDEVSVCLRTARDQPERTEYISMPIGHFVDYQVKPTCGIVTEKGRVGEEDEPRCFFEPERVKAQLIWLGAGYLEYRFPNQFLEKGKLREVEISAEVCSEGHDYNMDYPSDITLWVNGKEAGTWTCPSDFGGRRGILNPDWWPDKNTQYGILKKWQIRTDGTYLDDGKVSGEPLRSYELGRDPYITVRIGVKQDAVHPGGLNLFGEGFGDYKQNIVMKVSYE